jgi:hypothetical protein
MFRILGIVLILLGGYLIYTGVNRKQSLAGKVDSATTKISNSVDGDNRQPTHTVEIVSGAVLVVIGLGLGVRRPVT